MVHLPTFYFITNVDLKLLKSPWLKNLC